ncbi:hypothetical protein KOAAANKH_00234 [Brevundimonas sp. NIBR10]|uniref:DUF3597 domain-containing protein n=1 Tax=Brevundimonas sp. NIBR10 TaxID=3015997 RepID=UPI0022F1C28D|nr:DUF3597 domain-containing protein [Brevundimonas sp. NIBR10]WGM45372.1 hypothetical protein KOAAANKH_00234 [Brevundimonas sp. NIBR10]
MSILGNILGGIFGRKKDDEPKAAPAPTPQPAPTAPAASTPAPAPTSPAAAEPIDVAGILDFKNSVRDEKLNWRTSIVDLMKLLGLESSLAERKELADELGYTGDKSDSASMNIWLHKQVIQKIVDNGGQLPRDLTP